MNNLNSLSNGVVCVISPNVKGVHDLTLSATVKVGHLNEPKLGIAAVYETVMMLQYPAVQAVYGGTITSYLTGCKAAEVPQTLEMLSALVQKPELSEDLLKKAVADIVQHTRDRNVLPRRQLKLLYKHVAFNGGVVWNTDAYIRSLESLTPDDLQKFHDTYFTGKNLVIGLSGVPLKKAQPLLEKTFGEIPAGKVQKTMLPEYTGGYGSLPENGKFHRVLMGWDVSSLVNVAEANVMMSMLSGRLERSFADSGVDANVEVKIAGYYGYRTLRVAVETSPDVCVNEALDVICYNIRRLKHELASERRMETSRNRAMTEKLFKFGQPEAAAVEVAWQVLGRGAMYDVDERINATWQVSARDVQDISVDVFSSPVTCVICGKEPYYGLDELNAKLK